jgi:hypothetical protein
MHAIHLDKGLFEIVRTRTDVVQARRELRRICGGVERAMIGKRVDAQRLDGAILIGGKLGLDVLVTPV